MIEIDYLLDEQEDQENGNFLLCKEGYAQSTLEFMVKSKVFSRRASSLAARLNRNGIITYSNFYRQIMRDPKNFNDPGLWALYWALTEATHTISSLINAGSHEPELNGALIGATATSVRKFRCQSLNTPTYGAKDCVVLNIADMANHGNEARNGSDFGLIIELTRGGDKRYISTLVQAKRAQDRHLSVQRAAGKSTQLEKLCHYGIGTYLFYNELSSPVNVSPTSKSAELVHKETGGTGVGVDPLRFACEFPAHIAFLIPSGWCGGVSCSNPEDALAQLFNKEIPDIYVNDLMVCVLDQHALQYRDIKEINQSWKRMAAEARAEYHAFSKNEDIAPEHKGP